MFSLIPRFERSARTALRARHIIGMMLLLAAGACNTPPPEVPRVNVGPPEPAAAEPVVQVAVAHAPAGLAIDGDLGEWGPTFGGEPSEPSRVAVAITSDGAVVGARLAQGMRNGIWLGVSGAPSALPPVGNYIEVGGSDPDPMMGVVEPGCKAPRDAEASDESPPESPECLAVRRAYEPVERAHERRFARWYRIDAAGVSVIGEDGALAAVSGARVMFRPRAAGATAEVSIPVQALPRFAEAPVTTVWIAAQALTTGGVPELPALLDEKRRQELLQPVAFEPLGDLRQLAVASSVWMSYHPADPLHVEVMHYPSFEDRRSFVTSVEPLYRKQTVIGEAEVGYLTIAATPDDTGHAYSDRVALAVTTKGAPSVTPSVGAPLVATPRDGALHVLSFQLENKMVHDGSPNSTFVRAKRAWWSCTVVEPDGTLRNLELDGEVPSGWSEVAPIHDGESVGFKGHPSVWFTQLEVFPKGVNDKKLVEFRWRWDAKKHDYQMAKPTQVAP